MISSGSRGNAYLLTTESGHSLLLDAGVPISRILAAIGSQRSIQGCLVTHEHGDHSAAVLALAERGVDVYGSVGTLNEMADSPNRSRRLKAIPAGEDQQIGTFTIKPFDTQHDAVQPFGFIIKDNISQETVLYATDTYYLRYTFPGITYWIVECNYVEEIAFEQFAEGKISKELQQRLGKSHMSLRRLKNVLASNDLTKTHCIVLVHLSDERSDEARMIREIEEQTGIETIAASNGQTIRLSQTPF